MPRVPGGVAVVFDCDGVLVDSEPIAEAAWTVVLQRYGYTAEPGDFEATRGTSTGDTLAYYAARVDFPPTVDIVAGVTAEKEFHYDTELVAFDDAGAAVRALAAMGIPLGCASSSDRVLLDRKLRQFDLTRYFDVVLSADDVVRAKPAPDLYLATADALGVDTRNCVAVEDTEVGADAAAAAGMRVVLVGRTVEYSNRHTVVSVVDADLIRTWLGL